jgi:hypothetical protein
MHAFPATAARLGRKPLRIPQDITSRCLRFTRPAICVAILIAFGCREANAKESFEGWNLEPGVGQAHLVMVAKVVSISRVTVVEGAKTDVALREYRFQPIRRLKGIFQRDQLSMTAPDLGLGEENAAALPP